MTTAEFSNQILILCLENAEPLEFFSYWNGDETLPVEKHRWITLQEFLAQEFYIAERQLTVVYKDQSFVRRADFGFSHQAGFANPRLARNERNLSPACLRLGHQTFQQQQIVIATDQDRANHGFIEIHCQSYLYNINPI